MDCAELRCICMFLYPVPVLAVGGESVGRSSRVWNGSGCHCLFFYIDRRYSNYMRMKCHWLVGYDREAHERIEKLEQEKKKEVKRNIQDSDVKRRPIECG